MPEYVTVFLHHGYDLVESGPCEPCGMQRGKRLFRLRFIPFSYANPTYDDVVVARRDPEFEGNWAFECTLRGGTRMRDLHQPGGRYAMIVEYVARGRHRRLWFPGRADIVSSLAIRSEGGKPGRFYLAVSKKVRPASVMDALAAEHPTFDFKQIHPRPTRGPSSARTPSKATPARRTRERGLGESSRRRSRGRAEIRP
jgi:hypothetical protein